MGSVMPSQDHSLLLTSLTCSVAMNTTIAKYKLQSAFMGLAESQKRYLRSLGHQLKPVVTIGDGGLSESLLKEFSSTIDHHELIKVKVRSGDRDTRDRLISELCAKESSDLVARIGNVALIYRRNKSKPKIPVPVV